MTISEITFSQLDPRFFNAEYYKPEYIEVHNLLRRLDNVKNLEEISESIISGSYIREYVDTGTLYLRVNNIKEYEIDLGDIKFVDVVKSQIPTKIRVKLNDVLLTRTGTIGIAHVVSEEIVGAVISQHLTRITVKDKVNPFYLAVFLNTKLGRSQTERGASGSMQRELIHNIQRFIKISIPPRSFQDRIEDNLKKAHKKLNQADEIKKEMDNALYQLLGLRRPVMSKMKSFGATISKFERAGRFDAEYHQPKYVNLIEEILRYSNISTIGEIAESIKHPREFKREFVEGDGGAVGYIRVQNVVTGYIDDTNIAYIPDRLVVEYGLTRLHRGEILVTRSGTLGVAACVTDRFEGYCASADFLKVKLKDKVNGTKLDPVYVTVFLNSTLGSAQLEQTSIGALQKHITSRGLARLKIPIPSEEIQFKIKKLSIRLHQSKKEAREEIDNARRKVEEFVLKQAER